MTNPTHITPFSVNQATSAGKHDPKEIEQTILLQDGYTVSKAFYESVRLQVEEVIPGLLPNAHYTLKVLCTKEFWDALSDWECRTAGRCMADIVDKGLLSLSPAYSRHEYPKRYKLK